MFCGAAAGCGAGAGRAAAGCGAGAGRAAAGCGAAAGRAAAGCGAGAGRAAAGCGAAGCATAAFGVAGRAAAGCGAPVSGSDARPPEPPPPDVRRRRARPGAGPPASRSDARQPGPPPPDARGAGLGRMGSGRRRVHHARSGELPGPRGGGDRRVAAIAARRQFRVFGGGGDVRGLLRGRRNVPLGHGRAFLGGRYCPHAAGAAVVADPRIVNDRHVLLVDVGDVGRAEIIDALVVGEPAIVPAAALVAGAAIAEAVIDAAVEADMRPPVADIEDVVAADPAPVWRRPQHAHAGRLHPGAGHPVIAGGIRVPRPVAGGPDIPLRRDRRLHVDRQHRRRDLDRDPDRQLRLGRRRRHRHQRQRQQRRGQQQAFETRPLQHGHRTLAGTEKAHDSRSCAPAMIAFTGTV